MSETIKGKLEIKNREGSFTGVVLDAGEFSQGIIDLKNESGESNLKLMGDGIITVGGAGRIFLADTSEEFRIMLAASDQSLILKHPDGGRIILKAQTKGGEILIPGWLHAVEGILRLGAEANGEGGSGTLYLCDTDGKLVMSLKAEGSGEIKIPGSLHFVGSTSTLRLGAEANGEGGSGTLFLCDADGKLVLSLKAQGSEIISIPGMLKLANDGSLRLGGEPKGGGANGKLLFRNAAGKETMRLDGEVGDIILQNADCAEEFEVADMADVEPGSVVILDDNGRLQQAYQAYDKRVAGVISGAGQYKPGMVLDRQPHLENRLPIALIGKVYCKADAHYGAIATGDMLTTSPTQGHAMKVYDPIQGFGAVIGKALLPLAHGTGLIPILVSLQ